MKASYKGWAKIYRSLLDSEISVKDEIYFKTWIMLLLLANYEDNPKEGIKRGQFFTSHADLANLLTTYKGASVHKPSTKQVTNILNWLVKQNMIEKQKTTRGIIITIVEYEKYQDQNSDASKEKSKDSEGVFPGDFPATSAGASAGEGGEPPLNTEHTGEYGEQEDFPGGCAGKLPGEFPGKDYTTRIKKEEYKNYNIRGSYGNEMGSEEKEPEKEEEPETETGVVYTMTGSREERDIPLSLQDWKGGIYIPLLEGTAYGYFSPKMVQEYQSTYKQDRLAEDILNLSRWYKNNPDKAKWKGKGWIYSLQKWLDKEQKNGWPKLKMSGGAQQSQDSQQPQKDYKQWAMEQHYKEKQEEKRREEKRKNLATEEEKLAALERINKRRAEQKKKACKKF